MTKDDLVFLMIAPNGARRRKADHPAIPLTALELGLAAAQCREQGAAAIHLHVRDEDGGHSLDADRYLEAIAQVKATAGDMVIQITTEAVGIYNPAEQMAVVRAVKPDFVSMALRELIPDADAEREAAAFFSWMKRERIVPQFILYDVADMQRLNVFQERGIVPFHAPPVIYVLGRYTENQISEPADLDPFLAAAGHNFPNWMVCAFGLKEAAAIGYAFDQGGHGRVGFENNLHLPDGKIALNNEALVEVAAQEAERAGRKLMTSAQVYELLAQAFD